MRYTRRLAIGAVLAACTGPAVAQSTADTTLDVFLVGTGGPELTSDRNGPATLIRTGDTHLLFDAGRGVLDGIYRSGLAPQRVSKIFLTHLHNDHIEGLPPLWITPWFLLSRETPLVLWGPPGTAAMVDGMRRMFAHDLEQRSNERFLQSNLDIEVHEVTLPGVVYQEGGMRVSAFPVEHRDGNPALGYRIDAGTGSVVLTGDTTLTDGLLRQSEGADIVISNIAAGTAEIEASGTLDPVLAKLMRPEQAAELFKAAETRLGVLSHIVKKDLSGEAGDHQLVDRIRAAGYEGPLLVGHDGQRLSVGADAIKVIEAPNLEDLPDLDGTGIVF